MKKLFLTFFILFVCTSKSYASVEIQYAGNTLKFDGNPRLSNILERVLVSTDFYWHGAGLFDLQSAEADRLKKDVLDDIDRVLSNSGIKTEKYRAFTHLKNQILQWKVAKRMPVILDYDLVRIREDMNPRFDNGRYLLHLPFRVYSVDVIGAVEEVKSLGHLATTSVSGYFENAKLDAMDYADSEFIFIIHPNGTVIKVSLGLHNQKHVEVPPGGTIYVPISELPFDSTNTTLNEKIARLAGNILP